MKRRNFLKAIGLGALVAPAVVSATPKFRNEEYKLTILKPSSLGPTTYIFGDTTTEIVTEGACHTHTYKPFTFPSIEHRQAVSDAFFPPFSKARK